MAEARQHRRAGGGGLVAALERLAGFEQRKTLRGVDAERLEHLRREDLAHAALQRQPAIGMAAVGRLARALGAEVEQAIAIISQLGKGEAAAVADVRIVHAELMSVVTQRERLREIVRQRFEPAEVPRPRRVFEVQSDAFGPAMVEESGDALRKSGRLDRVVEVAAKDEDLRIGLVAAHKFVSCLSVATAALSGSSALMVPENLPARSNSKIVAVCMMLCPIAACGTGSA